MAVYIRVVSSSAVLILSRDVYGKTLIHTKHLTNEIFFFPIAYNTGIFFYDKTNYVSVLIRSTIC